MSVPKGQFLSTAQGSIIPRIKQTLSPAYPGSQNVDRLKINKTDYSRVKAVVCR